ncbi:MAG: DNA mismatch repair endonuclease MutL, partial [Thermoplasmata archaeon]|nr:DNA mismatch repair endonuclease MutL [Thermoplasmata archaeon]
ASVSRFRLITRTRDADSARGVALAGGTRAGTFEVGRAPGTTVEVRDLFFGTPARRRFLKAAAAEQVEVLDLIEALYLARPDVAISLTAEDRELVRFPSSSRLRDAAGRVYGAEFLPLSFGVDAALPGGGHLTAVLGRPERSRPNGAGLRIALNGRAIRSRTILQSVKLAYIDHLPRTRFPVGAVHLSLPIDRVDVNVHPTKAEVRIVRERELLEGIRASVRAALQSGPPGATAPEPVPLGGATDAARIGRYLHNVTSSLAAGPALFDDLGRTQMTLDVGSAFVAVPAAGRRPALRLVGCLFDLYWIGDAGDELWILDQHAASERLLFDRLRTDGHLGRQELMEPVLAPLTPRQRAVLEERREELARAGYEVEAFGPGAERVRAVPSYRGHTARSETLGELLDEIAEGGRATVPDGGPDRIAASIACHAAVRAGDPIPPEAMRQILAGLDGLADPAYACPHGRPIALRWSRAKLDRSFLRSPT